MLDELNQHDTENKTRFVALFPDIVSVNQKKNGIHVTMGVPIGAIDVAAQLADAPVNQRLILMCLDKSEYDKRDSEFEVGEVSDGYHTFNELYEHRIVLFIALCRALQDKWVIWKSKKHSDGSEWDVWFIVGISESPGHQITYHLPASRWDECDFIPEYDKAPEYDGHTPNDVLARIGKLHYRFGE